MPFKILGDRQSQTSAPFRLGDLPSELVIKVAEHAAAEIGESDSIAPVKDFVNFRLASKFTLAATNTTSHLKELGPHIERLGQIAGLYNDLREAAAPNGLPPESQDLESIGAAINKLGRMLSLPFKNSSRQFCANILEYKDEGTRSYALWKSKDFFKFLDANDRSPLIHEAIRIFTTTEPAEYNHYVTRQTVAEAYGLMAAEHHVALQDALLQRPDREELGLALSKDVRVAFQTSSSSREPSQKEMAAVKGELQQAVANTEAYSSKRYLELEPVLNSAESHGSSARQALKDCARIRDPSGR